MYYYYYYYYHHHHYHVIWVQFPKGKKQTNKWTQPPQVFPLTITARLITIVIYTHKQDISKTNINQYEFFSQTNQKTKYQEADILPHPPTPTPPIVNVPKTIAR